MIEPVTPSVQAWSLNHWTTGGVPEFNSDQFNPDQMDKLLKGLQQIESQDYTVACFEGFKFITYLNSSFFKDAKDFFTIYFMSSIRSTLQATDRYLTKYF